MEELIYDECENEISFIKIEPDNKKRKSRTQNFSFIEKQRLVELVKSKRAIWDLEEKAHSNTQVVDKNWAEIGMMLGKSAAECKRAWVALRESYRYCARAGKVQKSGSAGGECVGSPHFSEHVSTSFELDLSFLGDTSQKRKTFQSVENLKSDLDASCSTQYFYEEQSKTKRPKSDNVLNECLDIQKRLLEAHTTGKQQCLRYHKFWSYAEDLMENIPELDILNLQQGFINQIFEKRYNN